MPVYGKNLPRYDGFVAGDGVKDSSVYLDGNVLFVDVIGDADQGSAPAFVVRGLDANTNAPTELFRVNKDGSTTVSISVGVVGDLSSSYVGVGSVSNYLQGNLTATYVSTASVSNYVTATNASFTNPFLTTPILVNGTISGGITTAADRGAQLFNILAFGATAGPSFNNASAINAACSAAYAATGGQIYVPHGRWLCQQIILGNRVGLRGAGMRSTELVLIASQSVDMVVNHQSGSAGDPNGKFISVRDLTLNGNKNSQAAGHGINWTAPTPGSEPAADDSSDTHALVENVRIKDVKNDGYTNSGGSENRWINVHVESPGDNGCSPGYDTWMDNCTTEKSGLSGFKFGHGSLRAQNLKAFYSGSRAFSSNGNGAGFQLSGAGADGIVKITTSEAQDCGIHGWSIINSRNISIVNCGADSCGWGAAGSLATPGTWMAIDLFDVAFTSITGFSSVDRGVDHGSGGRITQKNAVRIRGSAGGTTSVYNYVQGTHCGMVAAFDASMGPAISSVDANSKFCSVIFNGNTAASASATSGSASQILTGA